jgi:hypothetical protein
VAKRFAALFISQMASFAILHASLNLLFTYADKKPALQS